MNPLQTTPLAIITGASRGLGLALVEQLLAQGQQVLAIARQPTVVQAALPPGARLTVWQADLADTAAVAQRLGDWLAAQAPPTHASFSSVTLIHNAGVVSDPAPLADSDLAGLRNALRVGLEAPLLLSAAFLGATAAWPVPRRLLMISSGLGRSAMAGSAAYCAAKAGMDHLARAVALEQAALPNGARVVSLAPGVIDTDMQAQLRAAPRTRFPEGQRFEALKAQGALMSPAQAAAKVLRLLARADFGATVLADVRDA